MGDKKNVDNTVVRQQSGGYCWGFAVTLCILSAIASFGVINYLQFEEIWKLKVRVEELEGCYKLQQEVGRTEEQEVQAEKIRNKRAVATDSLTGFITNLVQQEVNVLQQYCGNSSKICLPGQKGDLGQRGEKGGIGMSGPPGPKGDQGQYGVPGIPGIKGDTGGKGDFGPKGEKGDFGLPGLPGHKGARGNYGVPGIPGIQGDKGAPGLAGLKGQKGEEGRPLPFNQQCCSSLSKPQYTGNRTETVKAYVGQSIILPCKTSGYPPPSVTFTPTIDPTGQNRYIVSSQGMQIQSVKLGDSGQFKCKIDNILGTTEKIINLLVTDPVITTTTPSALATIEGTQITIACDVSGYPPPVVTWQHVRIDGQVVPVNAQTSGGRSVISIPAAHPVDAGNYICTGRNQYETASATTTITITAKPQITDPPQTLTTLDGNTVTLHCGVLSSTPVNITWTYPLTGSKPPLNAFVNPDNSVTLTAVDNFNSGTYTCTATNSQGSSIATANITVEKGLDVTVSPHVVPLTGSEPIMSFQCQANGTPTPSIAWSKDGGAPLAGSSKYVMTTDNLIVTGVDINTDTGSYECTGSNKNGNATDKAIVYRDNGQLTCSSVFNQTMCDVGQICGGKCPTNCLYQGQNLYGYKAYESESTICIAGRHTGTLPNVDNLVLWQHRGIPTSFSGVLHNGIQSSVHAQTQDSYMIIQPTGTNNSTVKARPLIG